MGWLDLLSVPLSAAINYATTSALNEQNAKLNHKYWNIQNEKLFQQGEQSADNAMQRSIDMYNMLQNPKSMVKQLKEAGLNPALMYSNGGMGGQTQSGPQGTPQAGTGAPTLGIQNITDPLSVAQIKNIEADTKKKEEEANNISQDTKLKQAQEEYTKSQTFWTDIRANIDKNNLTISTATINEQITTIKTKTASAIEELHQQRRDNKINDETFYEQINQIKQDYANSVSQGLIMAEEVEKLKAVTENVKMDTAQKEEETKKIKWECRVMQQEVYNIINDTNLKRLQAMTEQEQQNYLRTLQENIVNEFEAKYGWTLTKEDAMRMGEGVINAIGVIGGISTGSAVVGALGKPRPKVGFN